MYNVNECEVLTNETMKRFSGRIFIDFIKKMKENNEKLNYQAIEVVLTPSEASEIWDMCFVKNRKMSTSMIAEIATFMSEGKFDERIGNVIVFDENFNIDDGHHRVKGLIFANPNTQVVFTVILGAQASQYLDVGKRRSPGDNVRLNGELSAEEEVAFSEDMQRQANVSYDLTHSKANKFAKVAYTVDAIHTNASILTTFMKAIQNDENEEGMPVFTSKVTKSPAFRAAMLDAFIRGDLNSQDLAAWSTAASLYTESYSRRKNRDLEAGHKLNMLLNDYFGMKNTVLSLFDAIEDFPGGGAQRNRTIYYLTTAAIKHVKAGNDVKVARADSPAFKDAVATTCKMAFNFNNIGQYQLMQNDECYFVKNLLEGEDAA